MTAKLREGLREVVRVLKATPFLRSQAWILSRAAVRRYLPVGSWTMLESPEAMTPKESACSFFF